MRIDHTGKSALVTGSTQGIGLAIVEGLAAGGARVGVTEDFARSLVGDDPNDSAWWTLRRKYFMQTQKTPQGLGSPGRLEPPVRIELTT